MLTKKIVLLFGAVIMLSGCDEKMTYSYLMQHPKVLQKEVAKCQEDNADVEECKVVSYAANNVMMLINEQQASPEKFGDKLLQAQTALSQLKLKIDDTQQKLAQLKLQQASSDKIKTVQNELEEMQNQYQEKNDDINHRLAVLGLANPE